MKYLEVEEFDPGPGRENVIGAYPRQGLFHNARMQRLVYSGGAGSVPYVIATPGVGVMWADLLKDSPEGTVNIHKFMDQLAVLLDKKP